MTFLRELKFVYILPFSLSIAVSITSCTSGREAYHSGSYYDATIKSINRLREIPDHKKASETLKLSYPLAIEHLELDSKNKILANNNFKHFSVFKNYEKINFLYEEVKRSPSAMRLIPEPINKYEEMEVVREITAQEVYNQGIQSMLRDTREDAMQAYYLFREVNRILPGYKESLEMTQQAKFDATLKVLVEFSHWKRNGWDFKSVVFGTNVNEFTQFYSSEQVKNEELTGKIDQLIRVGDESFSPVKTSVFTREVDYSDSVRVGYADVNGAFHPKYEKVAAQLTKYIKEVKGSGNIRLVIIDLRKNVEILNTIFTANAVWTASWGRYSGDNRALSDQDKQLCQEKEDYMPRDYLHDQIKNGLDVKLRRKLRLFYEKY